jgi:hypothetical protein
MTGDKAFEKLSLKLNFLVMIELLRVLRVREDGEYSGSGIYKQLLYMGGAKTKVQNVGCLLSILDS